jgi:PAS domain S-box-containing protein
LAEQSSSSRSSDPQPPANTPSADPARLFVRALMTAQERATYGGVVEASLGPNRPLFLQDPVLFDLSVIGSAADAAGLLIFGPSVTSRIGLARDLRRQLPNLQLVFIVPADECERIRRLLRFAPGLADAWTIPTDADEAAAKDVLLAARRAALAAGRRSRLLTGLRRMVPAAPLPPEPARGESASFVAEQLLTTLVSNLPEAIVVCTGEGNIVTWNDGARRLFGVPAEEVTGRHLSDIVRGEPLTALLRAATRVGCVRQIEVPVIDARQRPRWIEASIVGGPAGGSGPLLLIARDVGERRQRYEQLMNTHRTNAIRQIAGDVAQDFDNILTVLLGSATLLEEELQPDSKLQSLARGARVAAERGVGLGHRLLAAAHGELQRPERVDVSRLLVDLQRVLGPSLPAKVELALAAESGCEAVVNRQQLEAALLSLIGNAGDAMPNGGTLELTTRVVSVEKVFVALGHGADEYVEIAVRDTGLGMSERTAARAFEPFFTTKGERGGTGLGLSIVQGFVTEAGGFVTLDSAPGCGTTVRLCIPRAEASAGQRAV